jgi:DNA end-binding protein Ku
VRIAYPESLCLSRLQRCGRAGRSRADPVYFDNAHYLGAGEGGKKPYRLLADALAKSKRAAIAQLVSRGKEELVLIRPYKNGLIMHSLYYANEVRDFGQIPKGDNVKLSDSELTLGANLIEQMSEDEFKPEKFEDEYRIRVLAMLDEKSKGQEIKPAPTQERRGQVIDLMQALKQSLEKARPKKKAAVGQKKRERA